MAQRGRHRRDFPGSRALGPIQPGCGSICLPTSGCSRIGWLSRPSWCTRTMQRKSPSRSRIRNTVGGQARHPAPLRTRRPAMKIVVIGGTGLIGTKLVHDRNCGPRIGPHGRTRATIPGRQQRRPPGEHRSSSPVLRHSGGRSKPGAWRSSPPGPDALPGLAFLSVDADSPLRPARSRRPRHAGVSLWRTSNSNIQPWHMAFATGPARDRLVEAVLEDWGQKDGRPDSLHTREDKSTTDPH